MILRPAYSGGETTVITALHGPPQRRRLAKPTRRLNFPRMIGDITTRDNHVAGELVANHE